MSENVDRLISNFNAAATTIKKQMGGKTGDSAEKVYGQAYQALVKEGVKPQIRKKYR